MKKKFFVTGGRETVDGSPRDDRRVPALVCYGTSPLDALTNSGITVWTEEEYARVQQWLRDIPKADEPSA